MTPNPGNANLNQRLRQQLIPGAGHVMPGAANALAARIIEATGHAMLMVSGAAVANTYLGVPDIGLVSLSELAGHVGAIRDSVRIPILVDGDTGFGNAISVVHTVRVLERAGANAIMLEDQTVPKRCGHFEGKDIVSRDEMVQKIKAAVDTRSDHRLMILARTDARAVEASETWERTVMLANTLNSAELLATDPQNLMHKLFWEETVRVFDPVACSFRCTCSPERVGRMLLSLGRAEVDDALAEQGTLRINCDFCNRRYEFDAVDCGQLFAQGAMIGPAAGTSGAPH